MTISRTQDGLDAQPDVFQRAVLGLARAGFGNRADISRLLAINEEVVGLVQADLRRLSYLDERDGLTLAGMAATRSVMSATSVTTDSLSNIPGNASDALGASRNTKPTAQLTRWQIAQLCIVVLVGCHAILVRHALPRTFAAINDIVGFTASVLAVLAFAEYLRRR